MNSPSVISSFTTSPQVTNQCPNHIETIEKLESDIRGYKIKISNLEVQQFFLLFYKLS